MSGEFKPAQAQRARAFAEIEISGHLEASRRRGQSLRAAGRGRSWQRLRYACVGAVMGTVIGDQAFDQWLLFGILGLNAGLVFAACREIRRVLAQ